jgi:hypothetical protein
MAKKLKWFLSAILNEIFFCILDYLDLPSLGKLRLVNTTLKEKVESSKLWASIWKKVLDNPILSIDKLNFIEDSRFKPSLPYKWLTFGKTLREKSRKLFKSMSFNLPELKSKQKYYEKLSFAEFISDRHFNDIFMSANYYVQRVGPTVEKYISVCIVDGYELVDTEINSNLKVISTIPEGSPVFLGIEYHDCDVNSPNQLLSWTTGIKNERSIHVGIGDRFQVLHSLSISHIQKFVNNETQKPGYLLCMILKSNKRENMCIEVYCFVV